MDSYIIYRYWSPSNKNYIGQTKKKIEYRANHGEAYKGCPAFYKAIQKYGWKWFENHCEILAKDLSKKEADRLERYYIKYYNSQNNGYNIQSGGEFNPAEVLSIPVIGIDCNTKQFYSYPSAVEAANFHGLNHKNISACLKHRNNQKTCGNIVWLKKEEWDCLSEKDKQELYNIKPYQHKGRRKPVYCIELNKTFESGKAAAHFFDCDPGRISLCCNKGKLINGKYHLRFAEEGA